MKTSIHFSEPVRFGVDSSLRANHEKALRNYEEIHRQWMNTRVGTPEGEAIKLRLKLARENYVEAYKLANPGSIVI